MKTAFEIACSDDSVAELTEYIKQYGNFCASIALKDSGERVFDVYKASGMTNLACKAKEAIESTPIVTP